MFILAVVAMIFAHSAKSQNHVTRMFIEGAQYYNQGHMYCNPDSIHFRDSSSGVIVLWRFILDGDTIQAYSPDTVVAHIWHTAGSYSVFLGTLDTGGQWNTIQTWIGIGFASVNLGPDTLVLPYGDSATLIAVHSDTTNTQGFGIYWYDWSSIMPQFNNHDSIVVHDTGTFSVFFVNDYTVWACHATDTVIVVRPTITTGGLEVSRNKNSLLVYPNPASDQITVNNDSKEYQVVGVDGKIIYQGKENKINVGNFANGYYFLKINGAYERFLVYR